MSKKSTFSPHQLTDNVKLLHKIAIFNQDKVLILKRSDDAFSRPGKWDLPGGNSEWPAITSQQKINLHQQDIVREIKEEINLQLDFQHFTEKNLVYFATYFEPDRQVYSVNCGWKAEIGDNAISTVRLSDEHTDLAWIKLAQLDQYDFGGKERDFETKIIRNVLQ